ncbi:MAG TPA: hypothetical protein VFS21_30150 [Roseiflexaceae bacterium]|nr:hypothetical protein [Roseiflexaceae bacterium]
MTWRTFRQRQARRRLNHLRTQEERSDLHTQRLDAQSRTLVAMSARIDLSETVAGQLEQIQNDLDARLQVVEELIDQLLTAPADLAATQIGIGGSSAPAVRSAKPGEFCRCGGSGAAATRSAVPTADESKEVEMNGPYIGDRLWIHTGTSRAALETWIGREVTRTTLRATLAALHRQHAEAGAESNRVGVRLNEASKAAQLARQQHEILKHNHQVAQAYWDEQNERPSKLRRQIADLEDMIGKYDTLLADMKDSENIDPSITSDLHLVRDGLRAGVQMYRQKLSTEESCSRGAEANLRSAADQLAAAQARLAEADELVAKALADLNAASKRHNELFAEHQAVAQTLALLERGK